MSKAMLLHKHHTAEQLLRMGQTLYLQGNYNEALDMFNEAAEAEHKTSLRLLDYLAATYEKLGDLNAALREGKRMLECDRTWVQGYLRTGKILLMMEGKGDLASKIYERGLRLGSAKSEHYQLLRKASLKLSRSASTSTAVDPLFALPMELIEMVFSYVPFKQLCQCLRVCKDWQRLFMAWPKLWTNLDFSCARKRIRAESIWSYVSYSQSNVRHVCLKNVDLQGSRTLEKLFKQSRTISSLSLLTGGLLGASLSSASYHASNLRNLHCARGIMIDLASLKTVIQVCPSLSTVVCGSLRVPPHTGGGLDSAAGTWSAVDYPNLRVFDVEIVHNNHIYPSLSTICPPAQALETLRIMSHDAIHLVLGNPNLAAQMPNLHELALKNSIIVGPWNFPAISHNTDMMIDLPASLRTLKLIDTGLFRDLDNSYLVRHLRVKLRQCTKLSSLSEFELSERSSAIDVTSVLAGLTVSPYNDARETLSILNLDLASPSKAEMIDLLTRTSLKNLDKLVLKMCPILTDDILVLIANNMRLLSSIELFYAGITGAGVKMLAQSLPKLKKLKFDQCRGISSDAITWARNEGIATTISESPT